MSVLDVFRTDAFNAVSMTNAINALPYVPTRMSRLGWFKVGGIETTRCVIERRNNKIGLVPAAARGAGTTTGNRTTRTARVIEAIHLPINDEIKADDVQGVRAFGTENQMESIADKVNEKMGSLKQSLELTKEYHRICAIQGVILDADGTTELLNLFDEFDITEQTYNIDFNGDFKAQSQEVIELMEDLLGGMPYTGIRAICGKTAWKNFIANATVSSAFERFQDNQFAREQQNREGFDAFGIVWECYRGKVNGTSFMPDGEIRFVPEGVPDLFHEKYAPANFIEAVNTTGKPIYAKQEVQKFDTGIDLHVQSNPLMYCTMPELLILGS